MKKAVIVLGAAILLMAVLFNTHADANSHVESSDDFFAASWDVLLIGTPYGDVTLTFHLTREEGNLKGIITNVYDTTETPIERIEEREESITFYWTAEGHYVNLDLRKEDENNLTGSLMGMFNASATRVTN